MSKCSNSPYLTFRTSLQFSLILTSKTNINTFYKLSDHEYMYKQPQQIKHTYCCVSLVSTRKEARWSFRFFSLFTVDDEGYVQQTNKQNSALNSNEDQEHCVATLYIYIRTEERSGKGNNQNVPEQLDLESSFTFKIYSDYACLKVNYRYISGTN